MAVSAPVDPIDRAGRIRPAFYANTVGHAQLLCDIIEAIDCWQNSPTIEIIDKSSNLTTTDERGPLIPTTIIHSPASDVFIAPQSQIIDIVKTICLVIEEGGSILPVLLPDIIDDQRGRSGLSWLLPTIIDKLLRGSNVLIDLLDLIGFFDIFTFQESDPSPSKIEIISPTR